MKSLGIIPARGGSKGISWKNITELNGKPLIVSTIEAAQKSNMNRVIVSTDAERIAEVARDYKAEVMMRPPELALDSTPILPVIQHVVENIEEDFDFIILLQPTSPFRTVEHINEALVLFENQPSADTLVSVVEVPHNMVPSSLMELDQGFLKLHIEQDVMVLRRQNKPKFYARNGPAILIINMKTLQTGELYNGKTIPYLMDNISSVDIDDEKDIILAKRLLKL